MPGYASQGVCIGWYMAGYASQGVYIGGYMPGYASQGVYMVVYAMVDLPRVIPTYPPWVHPSPTHHGTHRHPGYTQHAARPS